MTTASVKPTLQRLKEYQSQIEAQLQNSIDELGKKSPLRDACEYALLSGGKRLRPAIVLMIAKALGSTQTPWGVALSVELFHTASLIADDLPCMDNDDTRRGKASVHKAFSEDIALLASYALIAAGYRGVYSSSLGLSEDRKGKTTLLALECATRNTGILGATGGQFIDIYPPDQSLETLRQVIHFKTVTLYELAFVYGWLYGGGEFERLEEVKKAAWHFGMAFQISDDLGDVDEDAARGCQTNMAVARGLESTRETLKLEMDLFDQSMNDLGLMNSDFKELSTYLRNRL
ncbi:hypothetical protein SCG7109_AH_00350 [Chlamydiales bacterium SCGC AG-110-M15]|nr:hypothetical protein SCG7109_AH_00350 [Chlamydiales bacterium SCGC AG-110-M15]